MEVQARESQAKIMMARYYSAQLGRFLAVDPGNDTNLGNAQSWNRYAYVRNNPIAYVDPDGRELTFADTPEVAHQADLVSDLYDASPTFAAEIDAHSGADPDLNFNGAEGLPTGRKGEADSRVDPETQEYEYTNVLIDNSEHWTDGDLNTTIIEEVGHAHAARTTPSQAYKNRYSTKKTEQAARAFIKQVKTEVRQHKQEQRRKERETKRERKQQEKQKRSFRNCRGLTVRV